MVYTISKKMMMTAGVVYGNVLPPAERQILPRSPKVWSWSSAWAYSASPGRTVRRCGRQRYSGCSSCPCPGRWWKATRGACEWRLAMGRLWETGGNQGKPSIMGDKHHDEYGKMLEGWDGTTYNSNSFWIVVGDKFSSYALPRLPRNAAKGKQRPPPPPRVEGVGSWFSRVESFSFSWWGPMCGRLPSQSWTFAFGWMVLQPENADVAGATNKPSHGSFMIGPHFILVSTPMSSKPVLRGDVWLQPNFFWGVLAYKITWEHEPTQIWAKTRDFGWFWIMFHSF